MANHKSAAKRARQTVKNNTLNRARRAKVQKVVKAVEVAVAGKKDATTLSQVLRSAEAGLARAVSCGVMHHKTASRKTSRLAKAVKKVALAAKA